MSTLMNAREFLAGVLEIDVADLPDDPTPDNVEDWDSLAHGEILLALEDHISRDLDAAEIAAIDGIEDIQAILDKEAAKA